MLFTGPALLDVAAEHNFAVPAFNVSEYACNRPMMRLTVDAFGGETCEPGENCSEIGFATRTPAAVGNIHGSCGGR